MLHLNKHMLNDSNNLCKTLKKYYLHITCSILTFSLLANLGVLIAEQHKTCDKPLSSWIDVYVLISFIAVIIIVNQLRTCYTMNHIITLLTLTSLYSIVIGIFLVKDKSNCKDLMPQSYYLIIIQMIFSIIIFFPTIFFEYIHIKELNQEELTTLNSKLKSYPVYNFSYVNFVINEHAMCSICQQEYSEDDETIYLDCNHCFHKKCIYCLAENRMCIQCPICKKIDN